MKTENRKIPLAVFFLFVSLLAAFGINSPGPSGAVPDAVYGEPTVFVQKMPHRSYTVYQIVGDGNYVYKLTDDQKGIVQVYDNQGEYLHSICFYSHLNGAFRIAVHDGLFYVCDKQGSLYVFKDAVFTEFLTYKNCEALRNRIDFGY